MLCMLGEDTAGRIPSLVSHAASLAAVTTSCSACNSASPVANSTPIQCKAGVKGFGRQILPTPQVFLESFAVWNVYPMVLPISGLSGIPIPAPPCYVTRQTPQRASRRASGARPFPLPGLEVSSGLLEGPDSAPTAI